MENEDFKDIRPTGIHGIEVNLAVTINTAIEEIIEAAVASPHCAHLNDEELAIIVKHAVDNLEMPYRNIFMYIQQTRERINQAGTPSA
jgi:hypothetical protein